jgi:hypothetical protein
VHSPEGVAPKGVSGRVFLNLRRMQEYRNLPLSKQLSFDFLNSFRFVEKKYFHWNMGTYQIGELLGFFCWGRSLKIHIEIKRDCLHCGTTSGLDAWVSTSTGLFWE